MATEDDTNPGGNPEGGGAGGGAGGGGGPEKTYTKAEHEAEVNRIVQNRIAEASRSAVANALKELGVEDLGKAKADLEAMRQRDREAMSEADRLRADAETAKREADEAKADALATKQRTLVESALLKAKLALPEDEAAQEQALAAAIGMVRVDPGADAATITDAVKSLKALLPGLFEEGSTQRTQTPTGGDTPPRRRSTKTVKDDWTRADEFYDQFRPEPIKT